MAERKHIQDVMNEAAQPLIEAQKLRQAAKQSERKPKKHTIEQQAQTALNNTLSMASPILREQLASKEQELKASYEAVTALTYKWTCAEEQNREKEQEITRLRRELKYEEGLEGTTQTWLSPKQYREAIIEKDKVIEGLKKEVIKGCGDCLERRQNAEKDKEIETAYARGHSDEYKMNKDTISDLRAELIETRGFLKANDKAINEKDNELSEMNTSEMNTRLWVIKQANSGLLCEKAEWQKDGQELYNKLQVAVGDAQRQHEIDTKRIKELEIEIADVKQEYTQMEAAWMKKQTIVDNGRCAICDEWQTHNRRVNGVCPRCSFVIKSEAMVGIKTENDALKQELARLRDMRLEDNSELRKERDELKKEIDDLEGVERK